MGSDRGREEPSRRTAAHFPCPPRFSVSRAARRPRRCTERQHVANCLEYCWCSRQGLQNAFRERLLPNSQADCGTGEWSSPSLASGECVTYIVAAPEFSRRVVPEWRSSARSADSLNSFLGRKAGRATLYHLRECTAAVVGTGAQSQVRLCFLLYSCSFLILLRRAKRVCMFGSMFSAHVNARLLVGLLCELKVDFWLCSFLSL